ncbi:D-alanyl-D-alanine carboxypeptidase family protein [Microbacteriaceae bacterium 4G12]
MGRGTNEDRRARRVVSGAVGALVILAVGLYGPVTLLPPLPAAEPGLVDLAAPAADPAEAPVLPAEGASAALLAGSTTLLGTSGTPEPVPMAGVAKLVAVLVTLDEHPLEPGRNGDSIPVTAEDYQSYLDYRDAGARAIAVVEGDTWTQREMLQAVLLGSSNNHADALVRWAFGSLDAYPAAAERWLRSHGLGDTVVTDATGLDERSVGTAADLARLAEIADSTPFLGEVLPAASVTTSRGVVIANEAEYRAADGIRGLSRSFTDAAGVCLLFAVPLPLGDSTTTVYGAFVRQPSYERLNADMDAFLVDARASLGEVVLAAAGAEAVTYRTAWGDRTTAVVGEELRAVSWSGAPPTGRVDAEEIRTVRKGDRVGVLAFELDGEAVELPLVATASVPDPGPGWRLLNPIPMLASFWQWVFGPGGMLAR